MSKDDNSNLKAFCEGGSGRWPSTIYPYSTCPFFAKGFLFLEMTMSKAIWTSEEIEDLVAVGEMRCFGILLGRASVEVWKDKMRHSHPQDFEKRTRLHEVAGKCTQLERQMRNRMMRNMAKISLSELSATLQRHGIEIDDDLLALLGKELI